MMLKLFGSSSDSGNSGARRKEWTEASTAAGGSGDFVVVAPVRTGAMSIKVIPGTRMAAHASSSSMQSNAGGAVTPPEFQQCCAWSAQGLLAFGTAGATGDIAVLCANSMQLVQTLCGHMAPVTSLLWQWGGGSASAVPSAMHACRLYSADAEGHVALWDVAEGIMERSLRIPGGRRVLSLTLCVDRQLLVVISDDHSSFVYDAQLADASPMEGASIPLGPRIQRHASNDGSIRVGRFSLSPLENRTTGAFCLGDRVRIVHNLDQVLNDAVATRSAPTAAGLSSSATDVSATTSWAKDIIFSDDDDRALVVDARFSCAVPELIFLAFRGWVSLYDWKLQLMLRDQMIWCKPGVEFLSIFPDWCSDLRGGGDAALPKRRPPPDLYSFTTDGRLTAWFTSTSAADTFEAASTDVRGVRMPNPHPVSVVQSEIHACDFAVVFNDGSVVRWRFLEDERCWSMTSYFEATIAKPTCMCSLNFEERYKSVGQNAPERKVSQSVLAVALDSGEVVIYDAMFNRPLRRYNVVHSGSTKLMCLAAAGGSHLWVATSRPGLRDRLRFSVQIALMSARSGVLQCVLRDPTTMRDSSAIVGIDCNVTHSFLLVAFDGGCFEVWNTKTKLLLHVYQGTAIQRAFWGFPLSPDAGPSSSVTEEAVGSPSLIVLTKEGAAQAMMVQPDVVSRLKGTLPIRVQPTPSDKSATPSVSSQPAAPIGPTALICAVRDVLVCVDGVHGGTVVRGLGDAARWAALHNFPKGRSPTVVCPCDRAPRATEPSCMSSPLLVAVGFDDGTFGVWDVLSLRRLGLTSFANIIPSHVNIDVGPHTSGSGLGRMCWVRSDAGCDVFLAVLSADGSIYMVDKSCDAVNSSFVTRALRRPMQSVAFLKPSQAASVRSRWELQALQRLSKISSTVGRPTPAASTAGSPYHSSPVSGSDILSTSPTSSKGDAIDEMHLTDGQQDVSPSLRNLAFPRPCRGPLGQVLTSDVTTLSQELDLYSETMLPDAYREPLSKAWSHRSTDLASFYASQACGDAESAHFWLLVRRWRHQWERQGDVSLAFSKSDGYPSTAQDGGRHDDGTRPSEDDGREDSWIAAFLATDASDKDMFRNNVSFSAGNESSLLPQSASHALQRMSLLPHFGSENRFSEALADEDQLKQNRAALCQLRQNALTTFQGRNVDDAKARLAVARELIAFGDLATAADVLIDTQAESEQFGNHATLAVAIAAVAGGSSQSTSLQLTAKRAAAMLLARGDVEGATEKFGLIGEHYEAAQALQSKGLWGPAALRAKLSPMSPSCRHELLHRWALHCAQRGRVSPAVKMLLVLQAPRQALAALADSSHLLATAGLFAVALLQQHALLSISSLSSVVSSPLRSDPLDSSLDRETLGDLLHDLFSDYCNFLTSVGNIDGSAAVRKISHRLLAEFRAAIKAASSDADNTGRLGCAPSVERDDSHA